MSPNAKLASSGKNHSGKNHSGKNHSRPPGQVTRSRGRPVCKGSSEGSFTVTSNAGR